jgi:hypothetical protein
MARRWFVISAPPALEQVAHSVRRLSIVSGPSSIQALT